MPILREWGSFAAQLFYDAGLGFALDLSRMGIASEYVTAMQSRMQDALASMEHLEAGAVANADENRMVGHYWLRTPGRAPAALQAPIKNTREEVQRFAAEIRAGGQFDRFLLVGIGGSMLGPQFVVDALGGADKSGTKTLAAHYLDNTDPVGIDRVLAPIATKPQLERTLVIVTSKGGNTPETRNGMIEVQRVFARAEVPFAPRAVAITQEGSKLDQAAAGWKKRFPMWDWVGGRTSVSSAVGLLPLALAGGDVDGFLAGAARMDDLTRRKQQPQNPAVLLALAWHFANYGAGGRTERAMVVLPYADRLNLLAKYLQQLVMESLGKEFDRAHPPNAVHQGLTVYGNKGSTDQHSYIQQLRDGPDNYFATFVAVLEAARAHGVVEVEPGVTADDYLHAFLLGTRAALADKNHPSVTLTLARADATTVGAVVALFERAVGLYAELVNVNAYHQPGVQAGKDSADRVLKLQRAALAHLRAHRGQAFSPSDLAVALDAETIFHILSRLVQNPERGVRCVNPNDPPGDWRFTVE